MKDFKNIFATQLDIQEEHFGKKKSLVNCNSFQIIAAKHCSGRYVADVTLLELIKQHQFESQIITLQDHTVCLSRCNLVSLETHFDKDSAFKWVAILTFQL